MQLSRLPVGGRLVSVPLEQNNSHANTNTLRCWINLRGPSHFTDCNLGIDRAPSEDPALDKGHTVVQAQDGWQDLQLSSDRDIRKYWSDSLAHDYYE